jgi:TetR/AcrR family transcriptional regulator
VPAFAGDGSVPLRNANRVVFDSAVDLKLTNQLVSMARPARVSPEVILAAAALEFAERGFGGARVDRIARRAKVNKAMIYYHFKSKQRLYRTLLRRMFSLAAERLQAIAAADGTPAAKVDRAIAGIAGFIQEHTFFPAIMLREVAEGGAHLDRETLQTLAAVPLAVAGIVQEGVAAGDFRPIDPVFAYFSMLAPIVFYLAGTPIRKELSHLHVIDLRALSPAAFVQQAQESARRSLARDARRP